MKRTGNKTSGFTIVELLTVMGVIAVLIGLLVPALNMVKDFSREIQQGAQFHSIDVGLELFKNDFGAYPESNDNALDPINQIDNNIYCGANKLAEAMVGWDLLGFHPKSGFTATGYNDLDGLAGSDPPVLIYDPINGIPAIVNGVSYEETPGENIDIRVKYMELEHANAFKMEDVYTNYGSFLDFNFTLCDVFAKKRQSGKKTGMPILYYRARTAYKFQDYYDAANDDDPAQNNDIYNFWDNANLLALGDASQGVAIRHPLYDGVDDLIDFEDIILNKQVQEATRTAARPEGIKRPYRDDSYILISAGKDGQYGTSDDLQNFKKEAQ